MFDTRLFDTAEILPSCRTQILSFASQLEAYISDCRGANVSRTVGELTVSTLYGSQHHLYYTTPEIHDL
ncbi:MAG: hypothetical protein ACRC1Z_09845 [Waterburya sp.]